MSTELMPEDFPVSLTSKYGGAERGNVLQLTVGMSYADLNREQAYVLLTQLGGWCRKEHSMSFSDAIYYLKAGYRVARSGWNGKDMWLVMVSANEWGIGSRIPFDYGAIGNDLLPWIGMKTADNKFVPWLASQTDILEEDWELAKVGAE